MALRRYEPSGGYTEDRKTHGQAHRSADAHVCSGSPNVGVRAAVHSWASALLGLRPVAGGICNPQYSGFGDAPMRVLVVGASGMLGSDLVAELRGRDHPVEAPSSKELDITDPESVAAIALSRGKYDWCINCAAYTAVDKAESEVRQATELNSL